jgi:hypothetical protein
MLNAAVLLQVLRRAFRYDWRLWTIPELAEMLEEAGFDGMRAWLRPMKVLPRQPYSMC